MARFVKGDHVVYHKGKVSTHPGRRAEDIHPSQSGEDYSYAVDKFWTVADVEEDGTLVVRTRRGKIHRINPDDPRVKKASWLQNTLYGKRFPDLAEIKEGEVENE